MTLQSSGAISLQDIQDEFGGSHPISISEYYGSDTVPNSGTISFSDFYGTSAAVDPDFDRALFSPSKFESDGLTAATASIQLQTNGTVNVQDGTNGTWQNNGSLTASDYEVQLTSYTGFSLVPGSSVNTWYNLGSNRTYTLIADVGESKSGNGTLQIRATGTTTVITSASVAFSVESTGGGGGGPGGL